MSRTLKTIAFAIFAFVLTLQLSHKLEVSLIAGALIGFATYLTWWQRGAHVDYAVSGGMLCLIGIAVTARGDWLPGIMMFVAATACAVRANIEWKREHA